MTLVEIEESIDQFVAKRDGTAGPVVSVSEIKKRIKKFCKWRDENDTYYLGGGTRKPVRSEYCTNRPYVIREGIEIMRDKLK